MSKSTINWEKWARIETVILHDACGFLAGIDLFSHRRTLRYWDKCIDAESKSGVSLKERSYDERRRQVEEDLNEIMKLEAILEVVQNYIDEGNFIDIKLVKFSKNDVIRNCMEISMLEHGELQENQYTVVPKVNFAEFGTWAKSVGYDLPPEFPVIEPIPPQPTKTEKPEVTSREMPKVLSIIESLKALAGKFPETDRERPLEQMKSLILNYYGHNPQIKGLQNDLELKGGVLIEKL